MDGQLLFSFPHRNGITKKLSVVFQVSTICKIKKLTNIASTQRFFEKRQVEIGFGQNSIKLDL
jgi:hypothetical protein